MDAYKLKFKSGFHVDDYGNKFYSESQLFIHSDTLSSALLSVWALQRPDKIKEIIKNLPYLLSSAFPFYGETFFLPLPKGRELVNGNSFKTNQSARDEIRKKLKKIQFIPSKLWIKLLKHPKYFLNANQLFRKEKTEREKQETSKEIQYEFLPPFLIPKGLLTRQTSECSQEENKISAEEKNLRVSVNRFDSHAEEGQLFPFSRVHYSFGSDDKRTGGLYFLVRFPKGDNDRREFEEILALLGDTGLGGDKNSGNGLFEFSREKSCPIEASYGAKLSSVCSLSLFCPNETECQNINWLENGRYALKKRGGWIYNSSLRRKSLFMFSEGSCFQKPKDGHLKGKIAKVTTENSHLNHDVFRDGRGFFIEYGGAA